jgi:GT2 family glycosyltransferase
VTAVVASGAQHDEPRVAVIVLNWNGLALTRACLRSLLAQTWRALEVHVVDNGSANGEADALRAEHAGEPRVRVHALPHNTGFTGGCNHALRLVLAEGRCEYAALLNNDAEADPGWVAELVAAARPAAVGAVASRMRLFAQPELLDNAAVWLLGNGDAAPRGRLQRAEQWARAEDVVSACGGAVLLRCAMLRDIGVLRDDFFANFEDHDLMLRATVAGWRVRYEPAAEVRHHLNATIARVRDVEFDVRSVRNATWAFAVNAPLPVLLLDLPAMLLGSLAIVVAMPLLGRPRVAAAFVRGRLRALRELPAILAERRRLRPLRRLPWWRLWWAQRSFVVEYARLGWLQLRSRRGGLMERGPDAASR